MRATVKGLITGGKTGVSETDACKTEGSDTVDMYKVVAIVIGSRGAPGPRNRLGFSLFMTESQNTRCTSGARLLLIHLAISCINLRRMRCAPALRGSKLLKTQRCLLRCRVRSNMSNRLKYGNTVLTAVRSGLLRCGKSILYIQNQGRIGFPHIGISSTGVRAEYSNERCNS